MNVVIGDLSIYNSFSSLRSYQTQAHQLIFLEGRSDSTHLEFYHQASQTNTRTY